MQGVSLGRDILPDGRDAVFRNLDLRSHRNELFLEVVVFLPCRWRVVAVVIGLLPLQQKQHINSKIGHTFYIAFTRNNFAYALSWIICACHVGTGGIVRWFLSLPLWKPLGKMGLSFYLVHVLIQAIVTNKQPLYFNNITVVSRIKAIELLKS